ncbi:predicted protein [Nematostella vectensis]|uniref:Uncharacterized protein n=1 Tax=Nematostella vectensis TaxID=45351 RepID=A7RZC3_NEMVE|nr:predicted protein [Nematostella vectensis]|eukprot:XP_001635277.1 predicted protein [Nematostella vectensis]
MGIKVSGCFGLVLLLHLATVLFTSNCKADEVAYCSRLQDCLKTSTENYVNCCEGKCSRRAYCNGYCVYDRHCDETKDEVCSLSSQCYHKDNVATRPKGFCRFSSDCPAKQQCDIHANQCVDRNPCNDCGRDEVCIDGKCEKNSSSDSTLSFSPGSIVGFLIILVIGGIFSATLYKICGKRRNHPPQSSAHTPQPAPAVTSQPQDHLTRDPEPTPDINTLPLPADAPPPYHSITFNDVPEQAPPTYQEALRNSQNSLSRV